MSFQLTENQLLAVDTIVSAKVAVITGGAGSGKTTIIRQAVERLTEAGENVVLCAPTGKAAARVREATGYPARTVHSACGFFPQEGTDELGRSLNPSKAALASVVIIDEASMLSDDILAAVIRTIQPSCRLILVGDPNQLPPVSAGYPFRDLIDCGNVPHVHLDVVHRQQGKLLANCYAVLNGQPKELLYDAGKGNRLDADWGVINCGDDNIVKALLKLCSKGEAEEQLGVPFTEILVVTPLNDGPFGRNTLNRLIQREYHESRGVKDLPEYTKGQVKDKFLPGDRVIWTKNDRLLGLVNGDVGTVKFVTDSKVSVEFDGIGLLQVDNCLSLNLGWVLTCHKAQGSQYNKVIVIQANAHCSNHLNGIINKQWLYTAATRAKKAVFFLGSFEAFSKHCHTEVRDSRQTYLKTVLEEVL